MDEDRWHAAPEPPEEPPYCDICGGTHTGWCPDPEADAEWIAEQELEREAGEYHDLHND